MTIAAEKKKELLWTMLLSRRFEDELTELCKIEGKIHGMMILATGQEAVGSGACAALAPEDVIITNHRSHNHLLAKGADANALMAEIFCKATGCNKGKSGTLHLAVPEVNAPCTSTVVGAGPPIAVGQAFAQQYKEEQRVTVCFFGDGAAAEGSVHEAMNMAGLWRLPLIFICENNVYAGAQRLEEHSPVPDLARRAAGYNMAGLSVDGNDALAVYQAVLEAKKRALAGEGPSFIECKTYRCHGHGEADPQLYQPQDEISAWLKKCPIPRLRDRLLAEGILTAADFEAMEEQANAVVLEAVRFAEDSPYPSPEEALEDLFV